MRWVGAYLAEELQGVVSFLSRCLLSRMSEELDEPFWTKNLLQKRGHVGDRRDETPKRVRGNPEICSNQKVAYP